MNKIFSYLEENKKEGENALIFDKVVKVDSKPATNQKEKYKVEYDDEIETIEKILDEMKIQFDAEEKNEDNKKTEVIVKNQKQENEVKRENAIAAIKKDVYKRMMKNFINNVENKK